VVRKFAVNPASDDFVKKDLNLQKYADGDEVLKHRV
jgi:hypothetical protein